MKFGDWVICSKFIRRAGNHYLRIPAKETPDGIEKAIFLGNDAPSDGMEIKDEHSCMLFKTVSKRFTGIFVGITTLSTELECIYDEPSYGKEGFYFRKSNPQTFAIVYYADNRKRLVPLDSIEEADHESD